ncbi:hypothetical protein QVD17_00777 [Tagetes erecta]|uniref:Uncharacterized protein n=1 Tax=Tagetes erecta TaxID=13708 RepID=A0AAD8L568_TARER|nr:hypothetical protein QVD17_00777 [Tagetes erecta]
MYVSYFLLIAPNCWEIDHFAPTVGYSKGSNAALSNVKKYKRGADWDELKTSVALGNEAANDHGLEGASPS